MRIIKRDDENKKYIEIGVITNTHGLNGQLKIKSFSDDLEKYEKIYIDKKGIKVKLDLEIVSANLDSGIYIIEINNVESYEDALTYKKKTIYIHEEELEELEDEYYIRDILGSKSYDENGEYLGEIVDVMLDTNPEMFVINTGKKEICIPNKEEYIITIDPKNKISKFNVETLRGIF